MTIARSLFQRMVRRAVWLGCLIAAPAAAVGEVLIGPGQTSIMFSFNDWKDRAEMTGDAITLRGQGVTGSGGMGKNVNLDLSGRQDERLFMTVQRLDGNRTRIVKAILVDADGTHAVYHFLLNQAATDEPSTLPPQDDRTLKNPVGNNNKPGDTPGLDLANIVQWQVHGDWQGRPLAVRITGFRVGEAESDRDAPVVEPTSTDRGQGPDAAEVIVGPGNYETWFSFNTWEDRPKATDDGLVIAGPGVTGNGGAGKVQSIDLAGLEDARLAVTVTPHEGNQTRVMKFVLVDADGTQGVWDFRLPADAADAPAVVYPTRTANTLSNPPSDNNRPGDVAGLDLGNIASWQIHGDWQGRPLAMTIQRVAVVGERAASETAEAFPGIPALQVPSRPRPRSANSPVVERAFTVAPDLIAIDIRARQVHASITEPYVEQAGDEVKTYRRKINNALAAVVLERDGRVVGKLVGTDRETLIYDETITGESFEAPVAMDPQQYRVHSEDDDAFRNGLTPITVHQKATVIDHVQQNNQQVAMRHRLYLQLPRPLTPGVTYTIDLGQNNTRQPTVDLTYDPRTVRSEAVQVTQIGYHPQDPVKRAYLSQWLGTGGAHRYDLPLKFHLIDQDSGESVYEGSVQLALAADDTEPRRRTANHNGTDVYHLDFSDFDRRGTYRVSVEGVGTSFPFELSESAWTEAFKVAMAGFLHQRSGIELGPPFTDYVRPRTMHPVDGVSIFESKATLMDTHMGLGLEGKNTFVALLNGGTDRVVEDAWGGYMDAGDWDRRVQHLSASTAKLELLELFPETFANLALVLPPDEAGNQLPDVIDEVLWNLDFYRRLQHDDGGVPGGVESAEHPVGGETSWQESLDIFVFAPDPWASYLYAGAAARLAYVLQDYDTELADTYARSAEAAFAWAEARHPGLVKRHGESRKFWRVRDARNLSSLELYRLTEEPSYHDIFLQQTSFTDSDAPVGLWGSHHDHDAAFIYARLDDRLADLAIKKRAEAALLEEADFGIEYLEANAFNLTATHRDMPYHWGLYGSPDPAITLIRADYLVDDDRYLGAALLAANYSAGANPMNTTFMSGLGSRFPLNVHHLDSRRTGQDPPRGVPVYGQYDPKDSLAQDDNVRWPMTWIFDPRNIPAGTDWPANEAYFDVFGNIAHNEFTVHQSQRPSVHVWGYLAARPR